MNTVCRAITFMSYHIPLAEDLGKTPQYSTIGFFDGMFTERIKIDYERDDLKSLWKYSVKKTAESQGKFSYQNIFCFSKEEWNHYTDMEFWQEDTDSEFPLLFVVFLQLSDYMTGEDSIKQQCCTFNDTLKDSLGITGKYYTYGTIDKNDFVVCIRGKDHTQAVEAIKKLHSTKSGVVYSYSVLSISYKVLDEINKRSYPYLYEQYVDSICLKGITNSFNPDRNIALDQRYYEFCDKLVDRLYPQNEKDKPEEERAYRIYDILGESDFRLIARNVNLGKLLKEFGKGGCLGYFQSDLRFYLYSSSLVLNTMTKPQLGIASSIKDKTIGQMNALVKAPLCEQLEKQMMNIAKVLEYEPVDERQVTFCQALWQLLQSLKVLESAPAKKYDFHSLYHPFAALVGILEGKLKKEEKVCGNKDIYEFIHKISMTLHGTLRTDIQFFQIRDFNVIVHYAPAKLRAFYAIWALKLSEFYNSFGENTREYSFILSSGVFGETHVKQLFTKYSESNRLMLITTPERNLYAPRWLSMIIAHEVSHFVGTKIRERAFRHKVVLRVIARITVLEVEKFWYIGMPERFQQTTEVMMKGNSCLRDQLRAELIRVDEEVCEMEKSSPYRYHSKESEAVIRKAYRYITSNEIDKKIISDYGEMLKKFIFTEEKKIWGGGRSKSYADDLDIFNEREEKVLCFFERFQQAVLPGLLQFLYEYVCAESFADMIAILTINMSPVEYITSFVRNGYLERDPEQKWTSILPVRIAITMEAVKSTVYKHKEWLEKHDQKMLKEWEGDTISQTINALKSNSDEQALAIRAWGYKKGLSRKGKSIRIYKSMYNPRNEDETFSNKIFDFLNDQDIYKLLYGYLCKCADTYFSRIKSFEGERLIEMRKNLIDTYQTLAHGSTTDIMQEVENFLQEHEQCCHTDVSVSIT